MKFLTFHTSLEWSCSESTLKETIEGMSNIEIVCEMSFSFYHGFFESLLKVSLMTILATFNVWNILQKLLLKVRNLILKLFFFVGHLVPKCTAILTIVNDVWLVQLIINFNVI